MINSEMKDDILVLPEGESFPVNYGSKLLNDNKLFKKRMDELVLNYFDKFVLNSNRGRGVIVVGAPGAGKVYFY